MKAIGVAICVLFVAAPAFAQSSGGVMAGSGAELSDNNNVPETSNSAATQAANGEPLICRRIETSSSSRMATRRVCRTAEQWRAAQRGG